jgi:hypothetical protein
VSLRIVVAVSTCPTPRATGRQEASAFVWATSPEANPGSLRVPSKPNTPHDPIRSTTTRHCEGSSSSTPKISHGRSTKQVTSRSRTRYAGTEF